MSNLGGDRPSVALHRVEIKYTHLEDTDNSQDPRRRRTYELPPTPGLEFPFVTDSKSEARVSKGSSIDRSILDRELPPPPRSFRRGWRFCLLCGFACTVFTLFCNIALLILSASRDGFYLYSGGCDGVKIVDTWAHLGINTLSTLLLATSNYALQILVAPTRQDVNQYHAQSKPVDIASPSLSNWKFMTTLKRWLFSLLVLSGLPLHLLYNSAVVSTTSSISYRATIVSSDFLEHDPFAPPYNYLARGDKTTLWLNNMTDASLPMYHLPRENITQVWQAGRNQTLYDLDFVRCQDALSAMYMSTYSDILIFTQKDSSSFNNTTVLAGYTPISPTINVQSILNFRDDVSESTWLISWDSSDDQPNLKSWSNVQKCSVRQGQRQCSVKLIPLILAVVVVCNILKVAVFAYLLFSDTISDPILTLGDAIGSFLEQPDQCTRGQAGFSATSIRTIAAQDMLLDPSADIQSWQPPSRRYFSSIPIFRWLLSMQLYLSSLVVALAAVLPWFVTSSLSSNTGLKTQWRAGFGAVFDELFFRPRLSNDPYGSLVANAVIANSPQLALSSIYIMYNSLFTVMCVSAEWAAYVRKKKRGLRVTHPAGKQRNTFWLSLPYKISIPLLVASNVSHWLLSEGVFVIGINFVTADGMETENKINGVAWSPLAVLMFLGVQILMLLVLGAFSLFRFPTGVTIVSINSWAISAGCHSIRPGESLRKLQFGVIEDLGHEKYHVGFSSGTVRPLVEGEHYE